MFILRPSDPRTVLLWGDRWWLAGEPAPLEFGCAGAAVERLAAHYAAEAKPVRLQFVYQPDVLESVTTECPQGDRRTLALALADRFSALALDDCAWGFEPILAAGDTYSTVLHHETEARLFQLATSLAERGLAVTGAWPLATFLHQLPTEWSDSGATTVVAVSEERSLAYHHPANGVRVVRSWRGEGSSAEVGPWLAGLLARDPNQTVLLVTAGDGIEAALRAYLPPEECPGVEFASVGEALGRRVVLSRYHPAQLLPPLPRVTAQRVVLAASIALTAASAISGAVYAQQFARARENAERNGLQLAALREEVAHLRSNAARISVWRNELDAAERSGRTRLFLERVGEITPSELVLSALKIDGRGFVLSGWRVPDGADAMIERWRAQLTEIAAGSANLQREPDGRFTVAGEFRP